jgi:hypothetical protein
MIQQGGCLCGAVRYQIDGNPIGSGICHCRSCRKVVSAPALPFVTFPAGGFTVMRGRLVEYRSSPSVTRGFCGQCGSPLTYRNEQDLASVDIP